MIYATIHREDISTDNTVTIYYAQVSFYDRKKFGFPAVGDEIALYIEEFDSDWALVSHVVAVDEDTQRISLQVKTGD